MRPFAGVAQMQRSIDFDGDTSVFAEKIDFHGALSVEWNPKLRVEAKATVRLRERLQPCRSNILDSMRTLTCAIIASVPRTRPRFAAPARTCSRAPCLT